MKTITYNSKEWQLVPIEPTREMVNTVCALKLDRLRTLGEFNVGVVEGIKQEWATALQAAPTPANVQDVRNQALEEAALASESASPRHTECGNKIAAKIRTLKSDASTGKPIAENGGG